MQNDVVSVVAAAEVQRRPVVVILLSVQKFDGLSEHAIMLHRMIDLLHYLSSIIEGRVVQRRISILFKDEKISQFRISQSI